MAQSEIPNELLLTIFAYIKDTGSLCNLLRTSRSFHLLAEGRLYRDVVFKGQDIYTSSDTLAPRIVQFRHRVVANEACLARYVTSITIPDLGEISAILPLLVNLRRLSVTDIHSIIPRHIKWDEILPPTIALTHLMLRNAMSLDDPSFVALLESQSSLEYLDIAFGAGWPTGLSPNALPLLRTLTACDVATPDIFLRGRDIRHLVLYMPDDNLPFRSTGLQFETVETLACDYLVLDTLYNMVLCFPRLKYLKISMPHIFGSVYDFVVSESRHLSATAIEYLFVVLDDDPNWTGFHDIDPFSPPTDLSEAFQSMPSLRILDLQVCPAFEAMLSHTVPSNFFRYKVDDGAVSGPSKIICDDSDSTVWDPWWQHYYLR